MDPRQRLFFDDRLSGACVHCGGVAETEDQAPSKAFLDEPLPPNLPWADSCHPCNNGFALDEEYLASFIECVLCGTTDPKRLKRAKIARTLTHSRALAARIEATKTVHEDGRLIWNPEMARVERVVVKLARGHLRYEHSLTHSAEPAICVFLPLLTLTDDQRAAFECPASPALAGYPEIGSRAFVRCFESEQLDSQEERHGWLITQPGRYRYRIDQAFGGDCVQIVLSEYLGCRVVWE